MFNRQKYEDGERARQPPAVSTIMKYHPEFPFASQPMLLAAVLSALRNPHLRDIHSHWTNLVISCLPFFGSSLTRVSFYVFFRHDASCTIFVALRVSNSYQLLCAQGVTMEFYILYIPTLFLFLLSIFVFLRLQYE